MRSDKPEDGSRKRDGRSVSHRKGVAIGHSKVSKRGRPPVRVTMDELRRDIERGYKYFWSRPHRWGNRPEGMA